MTRAQVLRSDLIDQVLEEVRVSLEAADECEVAAQVKALRAVLWRFEKNGADSEPTREVPAVAMAEMEIDGGGM